MFKIANRPQGFHHHNCHQSSLQAPDTTKQTSFSLQDENLVSSSLEPEVVEELEELISALIGLIGEPDAVAPAPPAPPKTELAGAVSDELSQQDQQLAERINKYLDQSADQEAGQAQGPDGKPNQGLRGQGELIVSLARKYDLPVELMMAQLQKESSFLSDANNLSIANNNPGNLRFAEWEAQAPFNGKPDGPGNFTTFPSVEQGLMAYAALLRNVYGDYIDRGDWQGMVNKYAPPSENDSVLYAQQLVEWQADWRQKLGL